MYNFISVISIVLASLSATQLMAQGICGASSSYYMLWLRELPVSNPSSTVATLYGRNGLIGSLSLGDENIANLDREAMRGVGAGPLVVTVTNGHETWTFSSPANSLLGQEDTVTVTDAAGNILCRGLGNSVTQGDWIRVN